MRLFLCFVLLPLTWALPHLSLAQTVLVNEQFNGNAVDTSIFTFSGPGDESFFGRTQLNSPGLPGPFDAPPVANGTLRLRAQSFNQFAPGSLFLADEVRTIDQYAPTADTRIVAETRARFVDDVTNPLSPGLIGGIFFFGLDPNFPDPFERDEIDIELLSNFPQDNILTNIFNDQGFSSSGDAQFQSVPGLDITQFNDYRIENSLESTRFFINDVLIREQFANLATEPQDFRLNINVQDFFPAFSPEIQPTANPANNEIFIFEVDSLVISEEPTSVLVPGQNLITNGSFENGFAGWTDFNNAFIETQQVVAPDGVATLKAFGPFGDNSDASGVFQTVAGIEAGSVYSASVLALNLSEGIDTLTGTNNFAQLSIEFQDANGNEIEEVTTNLFDGREPSITDPGVQDVFNEFVLEALAPDGATQAVLSLFFIQIIDENGGPDNGAVFFDDVSFVELLPPGDFDPADFDEDGDVDADDLATLQAAFGSTVAGDTDDDGDTDGADFLALQQQFTGAINATAVITVVPEPMALAHVAVGILLLLSPRKRRIR